MALLASLKKMRLNMNSNASATYRNTSRMMSIYDIKKKNYPKRFSLAKVMANCSFLPVCPKKNSSKCGGLELTADKIG